ncbi:hypothetical protein CGZ92_11645 [Parenemella sanctibonifatiensis]|uniref:Uncharacterized protein n=1 Tax=Parenemella sanctibonifatiensis TaxID=2016505 RepID=A0A255E0M1_9ACTN|nr:hypothetical protein CGZ92_11645 [Parenemella sanctibonifatiensis]
MQPALADLHREFSQQGYAPELEATTDPTTGITAQRLTVSFTDHRTFQYQAQAVEAHVPTFGGRGSMSRGDDVFYRVEVFTQTGSEGYDLYGLNQQQVIDDVLDRYEAHLGFLAYSQQHDLSSVVTPPPVVEPVIEGPVEPAEETPEKE